MSFYGFYISDYFKWIWNSEPVEKPDEKKPDEEKPEEEKKELEELKNEAMRAAIDDPPPLIQPRKKKKWKR